MNTSKYTQAELLDQKRTKERTLAHLRLQINRAATNAPSKLFDEIKKIQLEIKELDDKLAGKFISKEDIQNNKTKKRKDFFVMYHVVS